MMRTRAIGLRSYPAGRAAYVNSGFSQVVDDGCPSSDDAVGSNLPAFNNRCPCPNHRIAPDFNSTADCSAWSNMYPVIQNHIMFDDAVSIYDCAPADARAAIDNCPIHGNGAFADRNILIHNRVGRDDCWKDQGEYLQFLPQGASCSPESNLAYSKHCVKFLVIVCIFGQLSIGAEIGHSQQCTVILDVGVTKNTKSA